MKKSERDKLREDAPELIQFCEKNTQYYKAKMIRDYVSLLDYVDRLEEALKTVVGHGYCEGNPPSSQDFVLKSAIKKVREALK